MSYQTVLLPPYPDRARVAEKHVLTATSIQRMRVGHINALVQSFVYVAIDVWH
jgi:hypothetical protein